MGDPTDTPTQLRHRSPPRHADSRNDLPRREQTVFDELFLIACRHATSLNRRADMDYERPMFLAMLIGEAARHTETRQRLAEVNAELVLLKQALRERGLIPA